MERFPEFVEFRSRTRQRPSPTELSVSASEATPEEDLEQAYERLQIELADGVLSNVRRLSPSGFERLVVDVMIAMGYGGGKSEGVR